MNLNEKKVYWDRATVSITQHTDENSAVRKAFIAKMREALDAEERAIDECDAARIAELTQASEA